MEDGKQRLARLRKLAWLLDGSATLPGTSFRFGLNSVIGIVPVGGDLVLAGLSLLIVWEARRLGVPPALLARMVANVGIEAIGGALPLLGDAFDMVFKANLRNVALVERHLATGERRQATRYTAETSSGSSGDHALRRMTPEPGS